MVDSVVMLQKSRRFDSSGGIGLFAQAVRAGAVQQALSALNDGDDSLQWLQRQECVETAVERYARFIAGRSLEQAFAGFERFRVLCAVREGALGVRRLNERIEQALAARGLIDPAETFYAGRPVMVTRNDYALGLFNGDVGLLWPDAEGRLRAWFPGEEGGLRSLSPSRLPEHETVFAMTVHKSQGSEFDEVMLILPDEDAPIITRELLYTGVTRARGRVLLRARGDSLGMVIERRVRRDSALQERLWGNPQLS